MNSEIIGEPTTVAWAFVFKYVDGMPRHPTQVYEALAYLTIFIILAFLFWKKDWSKRQGGIFGLFLILLFGFRFCIEFMKENQVSFEDSMALNMGQWLSIPFVLIGAYFLARSKKSNSHG